MLLCHTQAKAWGGVLADIKKSFNRDKNHGSHLCPTSLISGQAMQADLYKKERVPPSTSMHESPLATMTNYNPTM